MKLRKAEIIADVTGDWFIWSVNPEDSTVSCLPYDDIDDDHEALFVFDLKHFPLSAVSNAHAG